jgi:hypothetical protein
MGSRCRRRLPLSRDDSVGRVAVGAGSVSLACGHLASRELNADGLPASVYSPESRNRYSPFDQLPLVPSSSSVRNRRLGRFAVPRAIFFNPVGVQHGELELRILAVEMDYSRGMVRRISSSIARVPCCWHQASM